MNHDHKPFGHPNPELTKSVTADASCDPADAVTDRRHTGGTPRQDALPLALPGRLTFAGVPVAAAEAVMAERHRAIFELGHTPAADMARGPEALTRLVGTMIGAAHEDITQGNRARDIRCNPAQQLERLHDAHRKAIQAGAATLAAVDRIAAEINQVTSDLAKGQQS